MSVVRCGGISFAHFYGRRTAAAATGLQDWIGHSVANCQLSKLTLERRVNISLLGSDSKCMNAVTGGVLVRAGMEWNSFRR